MTPGYQQFPKEVRIVLSLFLVVLSVGVLTGLWYVAEKSGSRIQGIQEQYAGSPDPGDEMDIREKYPKTLDELLVLTHSHVTIFALFLLPVVLIFWFNQTLSRKWTTILMIEPLMAVLTTFGSIWAIRYIHTGFVWLLLPSSTLLYAAFFLMVLISVKGLLFVK